MTGPMLLLLLLGLLLLILLLLGLLLLLLLLLMMMMMMMILLLLLGLMLLRWLLLLLLLQLLLILLLLLRLLLILLLPTLEPPASPVPPFPSWTGTSSTGRLRTSGVQSMLIYHSLYAQRLGNHLLVCPIVCIRVTDDLIDLGTGDGRAGTNELPLYHVQGREVRHDMAAHFLHTLATA